MFGLALASCSGSETQLGNAVSGPGPSVPEESTPDPTPAAPVSDSLEETASVSMALINVPSDALCLEFAITPTGGTWGAKTQLFTITPGAGSATLTMNALPSGSANVAARTFGVACAQVVASTSPTWVSAGPVSVTLVAGQTISASIVLRKPGAIQITASFDDATVTITPAAKDFGLLQVGGTFVTIFTVTNLGTAAVPLTPPAVGGTDASQFAIALTNCDTSLPAGSNCGSPIVPVGVAA